MEKRDDETATDCIVVPRSVVYCMLVACMEDTARDPPLFRMAALEIEIAGVNMVDRIVALSAERACVFSVDVCRVFETIRLDEIARLLFGPTDISAAPSKRMVFVLKFVARAL